MIENQVGNIPFKRYEIKNTGKMKEGTEPVSPYRFSANRDDAVLKRYRITGGTQGPGTEAYANN